MPAVGRMMQLIEDDEGGSFLTAPSKYLRRQGHLLIRDHRPMVVRSLAHLFVCQGRIHMHAHSCRRIGPLRAKMIGGAHDQQPLRSACTKELVRDPERKA